MKRSILFLGSVIAFLYAQSSFASAACIKRYIFAGTAGVGKSSVTRALEKMGYKVSHEAATDLILEAQARGDLRPLKKPEFFDKIIDTQKQRQVATQGELQFYDRAPFCTYALAKFLGYPLSNVLISELARCSKESIYQSKVFFFEPLGFIENTSVRTISYEYALALEQSHLAAYKEFGFELLWVPKGTIEERCKFILDNL